MIQTRRRPRLLALAVLTLAALGGSLAVSHAAQAGGDGTVFVSPAQAEVATGGTGEVAVIVNPPPESLAAWVINVDYDPAVVQFVSCAKFSSDDPIFSVTVCEAKDTGTDGVNDRVVIGGAVINSQTGQGLTTQTTLGTITFSAVGAVNDCGPLTVSVKDGSTLDENGNEVTLTPTSGQICVVEEAGLALDFGDIDCNNQANSVDALKALQFTAHIDFTQNAPCFAVGENAKVNGVTRLFGDLNCDGAVNSVDALSELLVVANLPTPPSPDPTCPTIGTPVTVSEA